MGLRDKFTQGAPDPADLVAPPVGGQPRRFEYKAETIRSKLIGDKMDGSQVEQLLNQRAGDGWQLRSITETEVKGRVGPGGTMGLLLVFERPVP